MKAIILAGGKGTRLPISAVDIPKPLIKVGSKPILQHQIDWLEKHGIGNIRLSLGFKAEQIIDYLAGRYEYLVESEPLGTGGAIKFASQDLKEDFLVLNGDILTDLNLSEMLRNFKNSPLQNMLAVYKIENAEGFGLVELSSDNILGFLEKPSREELEIRDEKFINAGVYILSPMIFKEFSQDNFLIEKEIFPKLASRGEIGAFVHNGFWLDVGTEERLRLARKVYKNIEK